LKARLPEYMIPAEFVMLDRLPLTANGKVDRRALPEPSRDAEREPASAPLGKLERRLARIWEEILGIKKVGLHDNFFDRGGHSLLLVQLHCRLRTELERDVPITALFQYPTLSSLARYLNASRPAAAGGRRRANHQQDIQTIGV